MTLAGNAILLPFGDNIEWCLWLGVVVVGLGSGPLFGSMFTFVDRNVGLSSHTSSMLITAAMVGEFFFPFVVSFFIEGNPMVLMWTVLACSCSLAAVFSLLMCVTRIID